MREIKFRAWDSELKMMIPPKEIINLEGNTTEALKEMSPFLILMQFTGLKDKHGKEIYEGDIVKSSAGNISVVEWKGAKWGYSNVMWNDRLEIIGNIHENPELL